ncbi:hypothetical protein NQ317_012885 [Molorchus minor]|uniref:Uncharacterized protein n=1 Tax=Molorchus minor TaxID=1323400 RepID=A0ABQ9JS05_9CUCU|nr:hypothetical protein NQ317_012885 [Molorchus minor]
MNNRNKDSQSIQCQKSVINEVEYNVQLVYYIILTVTDSLQDYRQCGHWPDALTLFHRFPKKVLICPILSTSYKVYYPSPSRKYQCQENYREDLKLSRNQGGNPHGHHTLCSQVCHGVPDFTD